MKIVSLDNAPIAELEHLSAAGQGKSETRQLPIVRGKVDNLPADLEALVATSDLQGVARLGADGDLHLLGEVVAERLASLAETGVLPPRDRTGVLLAGDLFSAPEGDVRGISGDVRPVWRAFAARFRWVAGVAGNHDMFGAGHDRGAAFRLPGAHILDGNVVDLDGVRVGGVGGIVGDPAKPGRRDERELVREMRRVLAERPHVMVLHHGPDTQRGELRGHPEVRRALDRSGPLLVVCGHVYWPTPIADVRGGAQVLNADSRVVVLTR